MIDIITTTALLMGVALAIGGLCSVGVKLNRWGQCKTLIHIPRSRR